jgi:predicted  nucleic acid-binding Zn-ribbon protein
MDVKLDGLKEEYETIDDEIESNQSNIRELKDNFEEKKGQLKQLQVEHKKLEIDLETGETEIRKHRTELNMVKKNEQYSALLKEIEKSEEEKNKLEDQSLEMLEKIDTTNNLLKKTQGEFKIRESEANDSIKKLMDRKSELEKEIAADGENRKKFAAKILPAVFKKYEHIRKSREGIAIAPIEDNMCGRCHVNLPHQVTNEVSKIMMELQSKDLVYCDSCSRILYIESFIEQNLKSEISQSNGKTET